MSARKKGPYICWAVWVAVGAVLVAVGWFNNEDMYFGFIVMVMGLGFCGESRLNREIQELRYRIGELEYKNEQLERGRGLQQAGERASHSAPPITVR